ncbi:hypothetical protein ACMBCN_01760 [Candidatus Liberibacter asiaticus]|nr:hypothetical protein [Candidatus Liberibacter asiaticus]
MLFVICYLSLYNYYHYYYYYYFRMFVGIITEKLHETSTRPHGNLGV